MGRADMCQTGNYRERGIKGLDGYQTEYAVDKEQQVVLVPAELAPVGVLLEPLSIVEKAIDEAIRLQIVSCPGCYDPGLAFRPPLPGGRDRPCRVARGDGPRPARRQGL